MSRTTDEEDESDETQNHHDEIMIAVMEALKKHGYADLTTQKIADEFDKSQSLIHYHYGTKEDVVTAFLDYYNRIIEDEIEEAKTDDPIDSIQNLIDVLLLPDEEDARNLGVGIFEIHTRAPRTESYRTKIEEMNALIEDALVELIEEGIEEGVFRDVDPEKTAFIITSTTAGANLNEITVNEDYGERTRDVLDEYVLDDLIVGD